MEVGFPSIKICGKNLERGRKLFLIFMFLILVNGLVTFLLVFCFFINIIGN